MTLSNVGIVAHPLFDIRPRRGKITLGRFDVTAGEGDAALVKCFREVSGPKKTQRRFGHNLFRGGIVALQQGQVPARQSHVSIGIKAGRNVLQNFSARSEIAVSKHFEVSEADLGIRAIRRDFERAIVTGRSRRPVTQEKVIVAGDHSDVSVARIEGQGAFEACNRFAPASLPPICRSRHY
jgi:hypothetical protein